MNPRDPHDADTTLRMSRRIGGTERLFNWVARILLFLVALGIFAFVGYYVWVVAFAEPIPDSGSATTSQPTESAEAVTAPGTPPDNPPTDTTRQAGTPGDGK